MVHVHTPVASVLGRIAAKRAAVPHVLYTAHGFHFYDGASWRSWLLYYPMERLMARFTDTLITINREDYTRAKRFPVRGQVVHVPGVGLDVGYYQSEHSNNIRQQLGLSTDTFVISCIAELISRKNHRQLLFALKKFTEVNRHVQCLFVGDGEMEQTLKELVNELGLVQFVQFLGSRDDIPHILRATDVCVLLSKQEGLPRVVMEAMAAGLPVIATDIRGNSDLITHGRNGFLVPYGDVAATAVALQKLYKYPQLTRRI